MNEAKTQQGYLVLADISGYTSFLATTELEHAQEIMRDLLEMVIKRLTPPLILSKLEGDAVFAYASKEKLVRSELLLEVLETTYVAFRDKVESIRRRTTCECQACKAIPTLDLKFFSHYGQYVEQQVAGNREIVGSDVNLAHRLMKNHLSEETGWRAYAMFSAACLSRFELPLEDFYNSSESYEHLGEVQIYSLNLHPRYEEIIQSRRILVSPEEADLIVSREIPLPPALTWDWLNNPARRNLWQQGNIWDKTATVKGRTAPGAQNHCHHGKGVTNEVILDWRPFEYATMESTEAGKPKPTIRYTMHLEPTSTGTLVHVNLKLLMTPRWLMLPLFRRMMKKQFEPDLARMVELVKNKTGEADFQAGSLVSFSA